MSWGTYVNQQCFKIKKIHIYEIWIQLPSNIYQNEDIFLPYQYPYEFVS